MRMAGGRCNRDMTYNQLFDFLDKLDTSKHKHILMLYEEPESARLVQMRFINSGLEKRECNVYVSSDNESISDIKRDMVEYGIDVASQIQRGLLQFHVWKNQISDEESYRHENMLFFQAVAKTFFSSSAAYQIPPTLPAIRGVSTVFQNTFVKENEDRDSDTSNNNGATRLLMERLFHRLDLPLFNGAFLCAYQVDNISAKMDKEWMKELLTNHDAVLFLPAMSNGLALDLKK